MSLNRHVHKGEEAELRTVLSEELFLPEKYCTDIT